MFNGAKALKVGDQDARDAIRVLEMLLHQKGVSLRQLERDLKYSSGLLSRIRRGRQHLKVQELLEILAYFELRPAAFFQVLDKAPQHEEHELYQELMKVLGTVPQPSNTAELVGLDLDVIREMIREELRSQRDDKG